MIDRAEIEFLCPSCAKRLSIHRQGAGRRLSCPDCQNKVIVPRSPDLRLPVTIAHPTEFAVHHVRTYQNNDTLHCDGHVQNLGSDPVSLLRVTVEWIDSIQTILTSNWTFVIDGQQLLPEQQALFSFTTPVHPSITRCHLTISH